MNNTFYLLRHGETILDKNKPASMWELTEEAMKKAEILAKAGTFDNIDLIFCSDEKKAYLSVKPTAERIGKRIVLHKELGELDRDRCPLQPHEEFLATLKRWTEDMENNDDGWEPAAKVLKRYMQKIDDINRMHENKNILIGTHGGAVNLYLLHIKGDKENLYERILKTGYLSYAIVKEGKLIKDII